MIFVQHSPNIWKNVEKLQPQKKPAKYLLTVIKEWTKKFNEIYEIQPYRPGNWQVLDRSEMVGLRPSFMWIGTWSNVGPFNTE